MGVGCGLVMGALPWVYALPMADRVLFGLGDEDAVTAAHVRWSDGSEETFPLAGEPVDRYRVLVRGTVPSANGTRPPASRHSSDGPIAAT